MEIIKPIESIVKGINSNIQTVLVAGTFYINNLVNILSFTAPIFLEFVPDLITIKNVNVSFDYTAPRIVFKITSDLIDSSCLCSFPFKSITFYDTAAAHDVIQYYSFSKNYDLQYLNKSRRPIYGNYNFNISDVTGIPIPAGTGAVGANGTIVSIIIEFIKF